MGLLLVRTALAAVAIIVLAAAGGRVARLLRQPDVIGEIVTGLLAGLVLVRLAGPATMHWLLPADVLGGLRRLADVGLILFMVGVTHSMRFGKAGVPDRRATGWVAVGSFVPPLILGAAVGGWLVFFGARGVRGTAPWPALVLFVAVSLAVTAVPVLARILAERDLTRTRSGRIALAAAITQDTAGWLVLSVALSLSAGTVAAALRSLAVLLGGVLVALGLRWVLRTGAAGRIAAGHRPLSAGTLAVIALAVAFAVEHLGLTSILGAALVGVAIPNDDAGQWDAAVTAVSRVGRVLVPLFFASTGITIFLSPFRMAPWPLLVVVIGLAVLGKAGGGYLGARLGGQDVRASARIGTLMNTRGLTELVVLQVGYAAGILPAALFLTFVIMAVVTTAITGPALLALDRPSATTNAARRPDRMGRRARVGSRYSPITGGATGTMSSSCCSTTAYLRLCSLSCWPRAPRIPPIGMPSSPWASSDVAADDSLPRC